MSYLVLDTCVIVDIIKLQPPALQALQGPFAPTPLRPYALSIVTRAELRVMAYLNNWGEKKAQTLQDILAQCIEIPIATDDIVDAYARIEAYSLNKPVPGLPKRGQSDTMGKNDLWVAATASVLHGELLTRDKDFDHLHGVFFTVHKIG